MSENVHGHAEVSTGKKLLTWFEFVVFGAILSFFVWGMFTHVLGYMGIHIGSGH